MKFGLVIHHDRQVDGSPLGLIIAQHPRVDGLVISAVRESEAIQQKLDSKKCRENGGKWWEDPWY